MPPIRYVHRADIYVRATAVAPSGQKVVTWQPELLNIKCIFIPKADDVRNRVVSTTYGSSQIWQFFFPPEADITFNKRIYNVADIYGNIIEEGPIEVTGVVKAPFLNGIIHHLEVAGQRVMEE